MLELITIAFLGFVAYAVAKARTQAKIDRINDEAAAERIATAWAAERSREAKKAEAEAAFDALPADERSRILCEYTGAHEWLQRWIATH